MGALASLQPLPLLLLSESCNRFPRVSSKKNQNKLALWGKIRYIFPYRDVAQVVARLTGGQEAAGSSPVIPRKRLCEGNFTKPFFTVSVGLIYTAFKSAYSKLRKNSFLSGKKGRCHEYLWVITIGDSREKISKKLKSKKIFKKTIDSPIFEC